MTHYDTLGVAPTATADQIAAAYKRKARLVHPDRHIGEDAKVLAEAERAMRAINEAWEILGDPVHRRIYDESLRPPKPARAMSAPPPQPQRIVPAPPRSHRRWWVAGMGVAVIVAIWAINAGSNGGGPGRPAPPTSTPKVTAAGPREASMTFHDDQIGFTITYPRSWRELTPSASDMRLALAFSDNDGLELRVTPIGGEANESTITSYKSFTDSLVYTDPTVKLRRTQLVTLNGRLTYYYVTTYTNRTTGQEGVHEQYFIFDGRRMFSLRFQSEPASDYEDHAPVYATIADSFTVTRG